MDQLATLKEFGKQLDLLKKHIQEGREEQADCIAQTVFENYALARDNFLRQEDELIAVRSTLAQTEDIAEKVEHKLRKTLASYNSDFQLFRKFCNSQNHVNALKSLEDLPDVLEKISKELDVHKISIVLERDLCAGISPNVVPTFYMKGCVHYIDATLSNGENRVFIGPISKMMRPDIFFGDPEMPPKNGGSCFAFGLMNKYCPTEMIGLLSIYDPSVTRYHPEMGTDFLEHFCNSVASTLVDVINHQRAELLRQDVERITRHDLKTPLNAIINLPHLLLSSEKDSAKIELIKTIQDSGYKMLDLINRSYDIYRMESGTYILKPEKVDLLQIIKRIGLELLYLIETKFSKLEILVNGSAPKDTDFFYVRGEELLLYSMMANLIKNALEATPDNNPVSITLNDNGTDNAKIKIHNYGVVPKSIRESFFEKYTTEGKVGGTGLGTYSTKLIVLTHDGEISMESSTDSGTNLIVKLKCANEN